MASRALFLKQDGARRYAADLAAALSALRLNQQFPPWQRLAAWLRLMGDEEVRIDRGSALPAAREWVRMRAAREMADDGIRELASVAVDRLPPDEAARVTARRRRLAALGSLEPMPSYELHVALRRVAEGRASYLARVDRFDVATATVARYTLVLSDRAGRIASHGELELRASESLRSQLEVLSTEDASLAFAVLLDRAGIDVEEVVRGVVGPGVLPGEAGPEAARGLDLGGPALSACLERASLDVQQGVVDDPLATAVVVPERQSSFGVRRIRKWAVPRSGVPALRAWLASIGSRNLVYGY